MGEVVAWTAAISSGATAVGAALLRLLEWWAKRQEWWVSKKDEQEREKRAEQKEDERDAIREYKAILRLRDEQAKRRDEQAERRDRQADELQVVVDHLREDVADLQVVVVEQYGWMVRVRDRIIRDAERLRGCKDEPEPIPELPPKPQRRDHAAEFEQRTTAQNSALVKAVEQQIKAADPRSGSP